MATLASLLVQVGVRLDGALKVEQNVKRLKMNTRDYGREADASASRARRAFNRLGTSIRSMAVRARASLGSLIERMGGLRNVVMGAGLAVTGAAAGIFKFVDSQTAALDAINKTSAAVGVGAEEYQRLAFAASQSGVQQATLDMALRTFNRNMLDMAKGGGKLAAEALQDLGLNLHQLEGLSRTQQIGLIGDRLKGIADEGERSALAARIFGMRAGPQLATLLNEGSEGLAKLAADAGRVFTQEELNRATEFQDRLGELKQQVGLVAQSIALDLLPEVRNIVVGIKDWIRENDTFIRQDVPAYFRQVSEAARYTATAVGIVKDAVAFLNSTIDSMVSVMSFGAIPQIDLLGSAFSGLASAVLAPIKVLADARNLLVEIGVLSAVASGGSVGDAASRVEEALRRAGGMSGGGGGGGPAPSLGGIGIDLEGGTDLNPRFGRGRLERRPGQPGPGARRGGGGGGGGSRSKAAARTEKPRDTSALTWAEAIAGLQAGRPEVIQERLRGMAADTPRASDIRPTVAMTVNITNNDVDVTQNITAPDAAAAGRESESAIRRLFAQAAISLGDLTQVVR